PEFLGAVRDECQFGAVGRPPWPGVCFAGERQLARLATSGLRQPDLGRRLSRGLVGDRSREGDLRTIGAYVRVGGDVESINEGVRRKRLGQGEFPRVRSRASVAQEKRA